ncbi:hypothetical protein SDC9_178898 [bioreactor metagenome]|uniref:Zinc-ribbon domain-containing protein n=1 Tax=bioreactor metagenome TaxID=1076179 RepID=A0A645H516_9ZZZZ
MTAAKKSKAGGATTNAKITTNSEIQKLEDALNKEQILLQEICAQLGRYYADFHKSNPEPIFCDLVVRINASKDKMKMLKDAIDRMKTLQVKICPRCFKQMDATASYCTACGAKLDAV